MIVIIFLLCFRFPDKIGGNLGGVHYIRDVADANSLISSLVNYNCCADLELILQDTHTVNINFDYMYLLNWWCWAMLFIGESKESCRRRWWLHWHGSCSSSSWLETWYHCNRHTSLLLLTRLYISIPRSLNYYCIKTWFQTLFYLILFSHLTNIKLILIFLFFNIR